MEYQGASSAWPTTPGAYLPGVVLFPVRARLPAMRVGLCVGRQVSVQGNAERGVRLMFCLYFRTSGFTPSLA
jgi:hypothetical protein